MTPPLDMKHSCVEWDWAIIEPGDAEMESCDCADEEE